MAEEQLNPSAGGEAKAVDESHEEMDALEEDELKPHCMGHHFHWSEIFFMASLVTGLVLLGVSTQIDAVSTAETVVYAVYTAAALNACALTWNLVSIKRIAAASEMLRKDVKKFRGQNNRARDLQAQNKKTDAKMKENLADLEKAKILLKGNVQGLQDIQKEEEAMLEERKQLLEKRKKVADDLNENMNKLWHLTIDQVRSELEKRVLDVFTDLASQTKHRKSFVKNEETGDDGIEVGSKQWRELLEIIEEYGVEIDENDTSQLGLKTMAGEDNFLNVEEFEKWWIHAEEKHFKQLIEVLSRNRDLEDRIRALELGIPEADLDKDSDKVVLDVDV